MRIGRGGEDWYRCGAPKIFFDGAEVSVADLVWADDRVGEISVIDQSRFITLASGMRVVPKGGLESDGSCPQLVMRGTVEFYFRRDRIARPSIIDELARRVVAWQRKRRATAE